MGVEKRGGLTVTAPEGAVCGLYPGVPGTWNYFEAIHPEQAIPATRVSTAHGITAYHYDGLAEGMYHCAAAMEGHYALCRLIHYTGQKASEGVRVEFELEPMAGDGYEADRVEDYDEHVAALRTHTRPTAYLIPCGVKHEQTILQIAAGHAVEHYDLPAGSTVRVRRYRQKEEVALAEEQAVCFAQGVHVFPNTVPSTVLAIIMEPDFDASRKNSNLHSMGLMDPDEDGYYPVYRYCHDLQEGKVTME